ncbi:UNVERIFIED_CONTAM: hypothetical protein Sradi_1764500 [Sesamum radiatum]|uniref:Reverse transcriptase domain-containing protein n=1 Tax=Sesamum radiatum TaxID=300843 RepID=A0AAW2TXR4_SESRA
MAMDIIVIEPIATPLRGFGGSEVMPLRTIMLPTSLGKEPRRKTHLLRYLVVDQKFAYNVILERPGLHKFQAIVSTFHLKMKFPTKEVGEVMADRKIARECYITSTQKTEQEIDIRRGKEVRDLKVPDVEEEKKKRKIEETRVEPTKHKQIELFHENVEKVTRIGSHMSKSLQAMTIEFLRQNADIFAWKPSNFSGIDPSVIVHRLNVDPSTQPCKQRKRSFGKVRNEIIEREVEKLLAAGYVVEVQFTEWLSNVVIVPKGEGKWRICTDFTDLKKAFPKDPFHLPRIDLLVDSIVGCAMLSMMDAF